MVFLCPLLLVEIVGFQGCAILPYFLKRFMNQEHAAAGLWVAVFNEKSKTVQWDSNMGPPRTWDPLGPILVPNPTPIRMGP